MKVALLGSDAESLALISAAVALGHELVWAGDIHQPEAREYFEPNPIPSWFSCWLESADSRTDSKNRGPQEQGTKKRGRSIQGEWQSPSDNVHCPQWQILLDSQAVDWVIVGCGFDDPPLRTEQLTQLARQGISVLVAHPVVPSVLSYFEIDMSRDESGATFRYFHPTTEHPVIAQMAHWILQGHPELGTVQQIVCHRRMAERSQEIVLRHFSRDVLLLMRVSGSLNRLGAMGTLSGEVAYSALSVQMVGQSQRAVHWSVGPEDGSAGLQIALVGEQGKIVLQLNPAGLPAHLELRIAGKHRELPLLPVDYDPAREAIESMERIHSEKQSGSLVSAAGSPSPSRQEQAVAHGAPSARNRPSDVDTDPKDRSTWRETLLAMELTDTIEISLRRGRMIDVHHQQLTEHMAFKGMMSAIGCGVLVVFPMLLLTLGWITGEMGLSIASYWPHGLLLLLGLFLSLQVLPWLLYPKR